jgi:hypothetical protein
MCSDKVLKDAKPFKTTSSITKAGVPPIERDFASAWFVRIASATAGLSMSLLRLLTSIPTYSATCKTLTSFLVARLAFRAV